MSVPNYSVELEYNDGSIFALNDWSDERRATKLAAMAYDKAVNSPDSNVVAISVVDFDGRVIQRERIKK